MRRITRSGTLRWRRMGFRQQLAITFCVGILLASLTSSLVISLLSGQTIRDRFILEGHKAAESLALQSTLTLLYESEENGREYAETLLSAPDVLGVAVFDLSNKALLTLGEVRTIRPDLGALPKNRPMTVETEDSWYFLAPVYTNPMPEQSVESPFTVHPSTPELLGYAQVVMGKDTLRRVSSDIIKTNLLVSGLLAGVLLAALLFITGRVTRPIKHLADTMRRATSGESHIRAEVVGPRDVTAMQYAFNKMMQVLDAREAELKKARDSALESARIKGEFAATVSHELRTPLNGVLGMLELLQGMGLTPKQADYVEVAKSSGEALLALVNDILDFSRNDSGKLTTDEDDFDLRMVLDEIVGLTGSEARRKGLELGFTIDPGVPAALHGDSRRLQQVLLNLVGNAVKFTERGQVRIAVEATGAADRPFLHVEVRDSGIGVPEHARARIFEPFRQLDGSTTRKYGGSGLGLAICKQIVEFMGAEIGVRSGAGIGSTFWFTFPYSSATRAPASLFRPDPLLQGRRVLVVDDSEAARRMVRQTCECWGMLSHQAETLQEMLEMLRPEAGAGERFELILLDEDMAGTYGRTVLDLLSTEPVFKTVPTVLLCSRTPGQAVHHPAIRGYVDKPVRATLLHKAVTDAIPKVIETDASRADAHAHAGGAAPAFAEGTSVLVVEDNRSNQIVAAAMLERLGIQAALASSGSEAVALIRERRFDVILMDCNMPDMDGFQTTACIRSLQDTAARTPIIAMTANVQEADIERCRTAGMDDFIPKPLKLSTLRDRVSIWLDRRCTDAPMGAEGFHRAPPAGAESAPTLDEEFLEELRVTLGGAFSTMLRVFIEDLPGYLAKLDEAIGEGASEHVSGIAHTIKGSAANIGAKRLAELCRHIEAAGRDEEPDTARELYGPTAAEAERLVLLLAGHLGDGVSEDREADGGSAYILVVDDDRATRFALRNVLEEEGYSVIEADDGTRAIELCRQRPPELILMDAKMPVMDGFTACQFLKQQEDCAHIPVLIITGLEDEDSIERAFAVGATDYIAKPVNFSVLRRRIAHLMNASRAERNMKRLAYSDPLTGLPNRVLFTNHLDELLKLKRECGQPLAVMFVDVDRFKLINDTLGHDAGDMLLKIVAERLSNCVRENDLVARLGGDEFTIVIDNVASKDVLSSIARKICQSFSRPVVFLDREIFITLSIGISLFPKDAGDLASLMKHADTAMFHAKRYRNDFRFFERDMAADVSRRLELENDLRKGIERNELTVYYQPQACAASGEIIGMEALVRWRHPERGLVPPLEFIGLAEEIGLIDVIGDIVLHESCRQLREWLDRGYGPLRLAVNISGRQLEKREIIKVVSNVLITTQVPSDHLELEITESVVMENAEDMIEVFHKFKEMDIHLAIDDFGTGYSSLAYLKRFPVDTIKIDQSFVRDVPGDSEDVAIVTGVIAMAKGLGLKVVAEGVETTVQREFLRERGCDYIQGYCLSEPLPAEEFERRFLIPAHKGKPRSGENVTVLKTRHSP